MNPALVCNDDTHQPVEQMSSERGGSPFLTFQMSITLIVWSLSLQELGLCITSLHTVIINMI